MALAFAREADVIIQATAVGTPLLAATLALRGVRETVRQKQLADDRAPWWDQTKWAFDVVMSPRSGEEGLLVAIDWLVDQIESVEMPGHDLRRTSRMVAMAERRILAVSDVRGQPHSRGSEEETSDA